MDSLGFHKSAAIRQMIRTTGARLWYLPPSLSALNPIEQAFAKIKQWMQVAQKRTVQDTWRHISTVASTIEASECANCFKKAGYTSAKSQNALETNYKRASG